MGDWRAKSQVQTDKHPVSTGPAVESWGGLGPPSEWTSTWSPQNPLWRLWGDERPCPYQQESSFSGPAVEDSGGPGPASTRTRTRSPQDPLRRIREDEGPRPNRQEPGLLRTHCGGFRGTWPRVQTEKNTVSTGPAEEYSGRLGTDSKPTRTRSPQDPLWRLRGNEGPCPHRQEPGFVRTRCGGFGRTWACVHTDKNPGSSGPTVEDSGGRGPASTLGDVALRPHWGTWPCIHTDKNPVLSGPAVEDSGERGPASTRTRTRSPQDALWRLRGDEGPCPHRQEPGFVRTRCGDFGWMSTHVHTDKNPVLSGPAVEDSGERGPASTRTRTRSPQDPLWRIQGTWPRVHTDKNPVLSGPAVEDSGGRGPASTRTRTRAPRCRQGRSR